MMHEHRVRKPLSRMKPAKRAELPTHEQKKRYGAEERTRTGLGKPMPPAGKLQRLQRDEGSCLHGLVPKHPSAPTGYLYLVASIQVRYFSHIFGMGVGKGRKEEKGEGERKKGREREGGRE